MTAARVAEYHRHANGDVVPGPAERCIDPDAGARDVVVIGLGEVSANTLALNILAAKVARIRDEIAEWETDDSEHASAWTVAADIIGRILDGEATAPLVDYSGPSYCDRGPCVKLLGHDGNCTIGDDCDDCGGTGYTVQGRTWKNGYREDQYGSCSTCSPIRRMCVGCGTPLDEHPDGPPCSPTPPPGRPHG